jgi:natural product precursor
MKKINLKGISEVLSEKELKNVMGGSGSASCSKKACKSSSDCSGYCANIHSPGIAGCIGLYCM